MLPQVIGLEKTLLFRRCRLADGNGLSAGEQMGNGEAPPRAVRRYEGRLMKA
jgi:hypothetical protein